MQWEAVVKDNQRTKQFIGEDTRRRDLITPEREHDAYKARKKPHGPLHCTQCGAVYEHGRWEWAKASPAAAEKEICPACHRINDNYPAGEIHIGGDFALEHRDELMELVRHCETRENKEHPLSRIMAVREEGGEIVVTTTDIHLPHIIGNALERAYKRQAEFHYDQPGYFLRVNWRRGAEKD